MKASYEELEKTIEELKKREIEYKTSIDKYAVLFNQSPDAVVIINPINASILEFNDQLCKQLGYTREELSKLKIHDIEAIETFEDTKNRIKSIMETGASIFETKQITKSGEIRDVLVIAHYLTLGAEKVYHCIWRDITEQKKAEETIRKSEAQLDNAMKLAKMGNWSFDVESGIFTFNDNFYSIFETNAAEMGGYEMTLQEYSEKFAHLDDPKAVSKEAEKSISTTDPNYDSFTQTIIKIPNRKVKNVAVRTFTERDENGKTIRIFGVNQDITELKEVGKELQLAKERAEDSESQIRTLINTIPDLVWTKDVNGVYLNCNHRSEELYGVKENDLIGKTDYDFVDKDWAEFFINNDKKAIELGRPTINEEVLTFAIDGHKEYTETIKSPLYNSNNEIIGVLGIGRNITTRKNQELELIEAKEKAENIARSLNIVNEIAKVGSWELNQRTLMFTFSDNFYKIFKTNAEEMGGYEIPIDVYANKFLHPDDAFLVSEENKKALETNDPNYTSTIEHKIIYADGTTGYMSVKIFVVKDDQGNTIRTYGVN